MSLLHIYVKLAYVYLTSNVDGLVPNRRFNFRSLNLEEPRSTKSELGSENAPLNWLLLVRLQLKRAVPIGTVFSLRANTLRKCAAVSRMAFI